MNYPAAKLPGGGGKKIFEKSLAKPILSYTASGGELDPKRELNVSLNVIAEKCQFLFKYSASARPFSSST